MRVAIVLVLGVVGALMGGCSRALPPGEEEPRIGAGCAQRRILSVENAHLVEYDSSGRGTDRFVFGADAGKSWDSITVTTLQQIGSRVLAVAQRNAFATGEQSDEVVLLDGAEVLFHRDLGRSGTTAFLNAAGDVTLGGTQTLVRLADGTLLDLGEYTPISPVYDDAVMVSVGQLIHPASPLGRLRIAEEPAGRTFELFADRELSSAPTQTAQQLLYVSGGPTAPQYLIAASAHATKRVALPVPFDGTRQIVRVAGERYVLLGSVEHAGLELVDLDSGSLVTLPQAATGFRRELESATVDEHGLVYGHIASPNDTLTLVRTANGETFTSLGVPTPAHDETGERFLRAIVHGDNILVLNLSIDTADGGVALERLRSLQLTGITANALVIDGGDYQMIGARAPGPYDLSQDGACVAAWVRDGSTGFALVLLGEGGPHVLREAPAYSGIRFVN